MEFALTPDVRAVQAFSLWGIGIIATTIAVVWSLAFTVKPGFATPIVMTIVVLTLVPFVVFAYARARFGVIRVDTDGLAVLTRRSRQSYAWASIASLETAESFRSAFAFVHLLVGPQATNGYVVVRLNRSVRLGPLMSGGTEAIGVPTGVKTLRLGTPAPADVIGAARTFTRRGVSSDRYPP